MIVESPDGHCSEADDMTDTKGLIFDIKKYAIHDGPGIRTTVFLKGCPLECWWCHNPEGRNESREIISIRKETPNGGVTKKDEEIGRLISITELMKEIEKDRVFYDQSGGGVTFSGGEPLVQIDFLAGTLEVSRKAGIATAVDTCGCAPRADFERIYDHVDIFLFDLKLMNDELHEKYTGVSNKLILENLEYLANTGNKIRLRIPMVPGITDTDENLLGILEFISPFNNIKHISLLPYNKLGEDKIRRFGLVDKLGRLTTQERDVLQGKARIFEEHGYIVKVGG
ncbi:MAG: glycyl-radical enzyme activating protein [Candidatus Zixiibacteriota bacterium]|nr:MAG: glycyl-radical enzyme activating protein [candidate division Zixibacteria bacterium]HDL03848.1 glycyl-radical enzyme activating protein [candidate division Zixibacteria bacterium]